MSDDSAKHGAARFEVRATSDSHFGWLRTRMALERTQMSWVRTGTSLIAFGFTIYQVLDKLPERHPGLHRYAGRDLGLILIGTGIIAMVLAAFDYRSVSDYLWSPEFKAIAVDRRQHSRVLPITLIVLVVGILAFVAVLLRAP
jgi:inner membrane protein YidH